ncbi:MAG: hypothetical protein AB8C46_24535 [Burkholderiaceae bacterium]
MESGNEVAGGEDGAGCEGDEDGGLDGGSEASGPGLVGASVLEPSPAADAVPEGDGVDSDARPDDGVFEAAESLAFSPAPLHAAITVTVRITASRCVSLLWPTPRKIADIAVSLAVILSSLI